MKGFNVVDGIWRIKRTTSIQLFLNIPVSRPHPLTGKYMEIQVSYSTTEPLRAGAVIKWLQLYALSRGHSKCCILRFSPLADFV